MFYYFPMKSFLLPPPLTFCHIFSISYFLKYIRVPTFIFSKEPYAATYMCTILLHTDEQLVEIHSEVALH